MMQRNRGFQPPLRRRTINQLLTGEKFVYNPCKASSVFVFEVSVICFGTQWVYDLHVAASRRTYA